VLTDLLYRAGGGHSFGGGGGGGSSGFGGGGGGGGGFFFFGGGGGGGGAAAGVILVVTLVRAFVILRVRLPGWGRRGGWGGWGGGGSGTGAAAGAPPSPPVQDWTHADQPAINSVRGDLFPGSAPAATAPESSEEGLAAITAHDPGFSKEAFLDQVQRTFFIVQEAWTERQPGLSRQVMADGLWQQHRVQIQGYTDAHKRNVLEDLSVGDLTIIAAHHDANYDTITVRVLAACADYDVNDQNGRVIRGDKHVGQWMEDWTFQRSGSATTPAGGGTLAQKCPNCGAPLDLDLSGACKYCKAPVSSGAYDWVLARIAQVPAYY
jgi:predicted lipid-binding transport protein (Tim44 family)